MMNLMTLSVVYKSVFLLINLIIPDMIRSIENNFIYFFDN